MEQKEHIAQNNILGSVFYFVFTSNIPRTLKSTENLLEDNTTVTKLFNKQSLNQYSRVGEKQSIEINENESQHPTVFKEREMPQYIKLCSIIMPDRKIYVTAHTK